jgi:hypothetical protein
MARRSPWLVAAWLAAVVLLVTPHPAPAQTRLLMLFGSDPFTCRAPCPAGRVLDLDVERRRVVADLPVMSADGLWTPSVTADGRMLVFTSNLGVPVFTPTYLRAVDLTSYAQFTIGLSLHGPIAAVVPDPSAVRVFTQPGRDQPVATVDYSGMHWLPNPDGVQYNELRILSGDGSRLFVHSSPLGAPTSSLVLDSDTGALVAAIPNAYVFASNDAGDEVYAMTDEPLNGRLRRIHVASGAILADVESTGLVARDPRSGRIWDGPRVRDGATLAVAANLDVRTPVPASSAIVFDRDRPYVFMASRAEESSAPLRLVVVNTETFAVEASADFAIRAPLVGLALAPRPPAVQGLAATVDGSTVTLNWSHTTTGGVVTELVVEAGSAPGRSDLGQLRAAPGSTSLAVRGVPAGTYYVRMRSRNVTGVASVSNEIAVVVRPPGAPH